MVGTNDQYHNLNGQALKKVKETVGNDYPVLIKLNTYERAARGIKADDCIGFAEMVAQTGCCDAIEFSCGTNEGGFIMARGKFPTDAIFSFMRPYCDYHSLIQFFMKVFVIPFVKLTQPPFQEGYNLETAARAKAKIPLPVITVGGMRSKALMEDAIESSQTDFVSMARPLILEPDLPNKFRTGQSETAMCDNCNQCVVAADTRPIQCYRK